MQLRSLLIFTTQKLLRLGLLLLAVAIFTFVLLSLSPIDPVQAYIGADMMQISPEQRQLIAERWGLDQPMLLRFGDWLGQLVQGNWGTSMVFNQPVGEVIASRFSVSVQMLAIAWLLSGLLGLGLGIVAGALAGTWIDRAIRLYAYTLASSPTFWVALLLLIVFSVSLKVTPICCAAPPGRLAADVTFWQHLHHLLLPALTLSIIGVASITLHTRQKLIEVLHSDYVLFARAQGESLWGVIRHHGLRNLILPALTLQFASLSELFGGAVLVEQVFAYPGLGEATVQAALRSDIPLLVGIVFFSALFVYTGNTLADLAYPLIDPRIRLGG
ncbi:MAG: ABC transporter permease [Cyanobacteria bacterium P01_H01_bin.162]